MSLEYFWSLPTAQPVPPGTDALRHWTNAARAAEIAGFDGLLLPSGPRRPDAWLLAAALAPQLRRIRFLLGLRPGFVLPAVAAQRAATLLQIAGPRLAFSVLAGTDTAEHRTYGDVVNHDDRFARAGEFLQVLAQAWKGRGTGSGFAHEGAHYRIEGGGLYRPPADPLPPLYIGGGTPAAERVAAAHAQVYYHWAAAPDTFAARLRRVADLAAAEGRTLRFGVRAHLVVRETEAQALEELGRVWVQSRRESPALDAYTQVSAGLWITPGSGRALLAGSPAQVAAQLEALHGLGADSFILSADDALGDPLRIAEDVLPLVRS